MFGKGLEARAVDRAINHARCGRPSQRRAARKVRLKDCKRPRPLTLRANVGDLIEIRFTNLLRPAQPDISKTFCGIKPAKGIDAILSNQRYNACEVCSKEVEKNGLKTNACRSQPREKNKKHLGRQVPTGRAHAPSHLPCPACNRLPSTARLTRPALGLRAVASGDALTCRFKLNNEGTHLFSSATAPAGGEGDSGSLTHVLFGGLIVEPAGSKSYRSQVSKAAFDAAWAPNTALSVLHARQDKLGYDTKIAIANTRGSRGDLGVCLTTAPSIEIPVLEVDRACANTPVTIDSKPYAPYKIVHGDLNAVVVPKELDANAVEGKTARPFREFTVIFHDELKTYCTNAFQELGKFGPLSGVRDDFGINYGASGAGSLVMANRKKIGPAADCPECLYEEFFLESWANGDPALLESFPDDPSNVHHSYLNDRIVFRNFHAGPKETHVFHLHSHQWFAGNDWDRGSYLDSQTIGPQQGMSYWIYQGGLERHAPNVFSSLLPRIL
jgi:manganese oxidase